MPALDRHFAHWPPAAPRQLDLPAQTVADNLAQAARRWPDRPALHFYGRDWSYAELWRQVEALAGWLQHQGIVPGDRVLLYAQNSPQWIVGYYGILRADAVVVPVNPMNRLAELEHLVADTGARLAIAGQELLPHVAPLIGRGLDRVLVATYAELADPEHDLALPPALAALDPAAVEGPGLTRWTQALGEARMPGPASANGDSIAVIPYSSGTTGQPKGCVHTNRSVQSTVIGGVLWNPVTETDVHLAALPLFHVTGMQSSMNGPLLTGGRIVILTRWNAATAAELIRRHRITRFRSISTMMIDMINNPDIDTWDLSSLSMLGGGGAAMPETIARKLKDKTGLDYVEGYGLSETIAATHINPPQRPRRQCLGIPVFEVDSRILSLTDGAELGPNQSGEIVVHAPQVFQGYWQNPEATAAAFVEIDGKPFFRTGDIGYYDEDGYFYMVDRVKRMINASGFKVWPAEVEMLMLRHPAVAEACVIGAEDPRRGETVRAYVVPAAGAQLTEAELIAWCHQQMAAYKCPTSVVFTTDLPKSGAGKVLWRELAEQDRNRREAS